MNEYKQLQEELRDYFDQPRNAKWLAGKLPYNEDREVEVSGGRKMTLKEVGEYIDNKAFEDEYTGIYFIKAKDLKKLFPDNVNVEGLTDLDDEDEFPLFRYWHEKYGKSDCLNSEPEFDSIEEKAYEYYFDSEPEDEEEALQFRLAATRQAIDTDIRRGNTTFRRFDNTPPDYIFGEVSR